MKKVVVLMVLIGALTGFSLGAGEEKASEPAAACESSAGQQSTEHQTKDLPEPLLLAKPASSGIPECPAVQSCAGGSFACNGNNACGPTGPAKLRDTGSSQCTRNGQVLACIIGTIHVKKQKCGLCPCCFSQPACLCPNDPTVCGTAITLVCQ